MFSCFTVHWFVISRVFTLVFSRFSRYKLFRTSFSRVSSNSFRYASGVLRKNGFGKRWIYCVAEFEVLWTRSGRSTRKLQRTKFVGVCGYNPCSFTLAERICVFTIQVYYSWLFALYISPRRNV